MEHLIAVSEADGYWTLQAQMVTANNTSRTLHRKCGFREVGIRERYGHIENIWHDVVLLERRSQRTGAPDLPTKTCDS